MISSSFSNILKSGLKSHSIHRSIHRSVHRSNSSTSSTSFWSRKIKGRRGQTALQIGASVGLLITFVLIPTFRNYVKSWQTKKYDSSATRDYIHEEVFKRRLEDRRLLGLKTEFHRDEGEA
ncbi:hypothetical protein TrVE_jg10923 [Triparma verrucosa]|uniref:Uncharacterized protein n=1 Tax=Triparma verrucosa TaxID=1606542 RepID=A0A9W7FKU1_9STRA|nr:hypothetical protein TrVE_jg10923 [Triparma verrucosa]